MEEAHAGIVEAFNEIKFRIDCILGEVGPNKLEAEVDQNSEDCPNQREIIVSIA